ncbi:MAG: hypothetical protein ACJATI_003729 [Halioglobus sp.]|jgi:hypothetical protein
MWKLDNKSSDLFNKMFFIALLINIFPLIFGLFVFGQGSIFYTLPYAVIYGIIYFWICRVTFSLLMYMYNWLYQKYNLKFHAAAILAGAIIFILLSCMKIIGLIEETLELRFYNDVLTFILIFCFGYYCCPPDKK